ncbi:MAG: M28 family peptidase [Gemmatimonadetes bacterium]|nr:M28 family peptidase [Gemmatimonadota bacterium]
MALGACEPAGPPGIDAITEEALSSDLYALAHDSMQGRLTGTAEIGRAAEWIAERYATLGLVPAGDDGSFYQSFALTWVTLGDGNRLSLPGPGGARPAGQGWTPMGISANGSATGEVAFAGYGIVEPRVGWDDYGDADVTGKIVLVLEREPGVDDPASPFDGVVTSEASRDWRKVLSAQERGAVAVLFVRDVHARSDVDDWSAFHTAAWPDRPRRIERFVLQAWAEGVTVPVAQISTPMAEQLLAASGRTLAELAAAADASGSGHGVVPLPGSRVSLTTSVERHRTPGRNIIGMVEGSDPALADEVVIVGAHHDHNGADGAEIFNGADDDGSGTVGVLAVAAAYAAALEQGERPRRTVLFAVWDAEERGLLGAWYYTTAPRFPLTATVANLNMDMIGRNEEVPEDGGGRFNGLEPQSAEANANAINILGFTRSPQLAAVIEAANEETDLLLRFRYDNNESNLLRRSDHWPFLQNGVPAVWFHTGLHPDYHTPDDDADRINYEKMTRIVQLVHRTSWELANSEQRPALEGMGSRPRS